MQKVTYSYKENSIGNLFFSKEKTLEEKAEWKILYEKDNHLGNVLSVVSDRKLSADSDNNGTIDYYTAEMLFAGDYYAGVGMVQPGRHFEITDYRYGAQGSEVVKELGGDRNHITTYYREGDLEALRWWSPDPVVDPSESPYAMNKNNGVRYNDPNGDIPPLIIKGLAGLAAAGVEAGVQFSIEYSKEGATFTSAIKKMDAADIGAAFVEGVVTTGGSIPKILVKKAMSEGVKASVDRTAEKGFQTTELIGGSKATDETLIDFGAGVAGNKAASKIISSAGEGVAKDIASGTFSALSKAEKHTLRNVQKTVKSETFKTGVESVSDYGAGSIGESLKSSGGGMPAPMDFKPSPAPSDNTRVATPAPRFK